MTEKHRDPEYIRNAKIVRARVRRAWRLGQDVRCWRTGRVLILVARSTWVTSIRTADTPSRTSRPSR